MKKMVITTLLTAICGLALAQVAAPAKQSSDQLAAKEAAPKSKNSSKHKKQESKNANEKKDAATSPGK